MPDLSFSLEGIDPVPFAAAPELDFRLQVTNRTPAEQIHNIALHCQIQIDAIRRHYGSSDHERLLDLFGEPERWGQTMRSLLWTIATVNVPPFSESIIAHLHVPCTFDFNVAVAKFFYALEDGEVPLTLLFSGTIFYETEQAGLQISQISWESEATYRMQVAVWKALMDEYYPNTAWINLRRDVFDRLYRYKIQHGIPSWEQTLESLLAEKVELGSIMNLELADRIAKAVLYEGYVLYPYTPSSLKNQQRWTFGGIYPEAYARAQGGIDPWWMQTEVLVQAGAAAKLDCRVRFLHLQERTVAEAGSSPVGEMDGIAFRPVESLQVGSRYYIPWQEAVERECSSTGISLNTLLEQPNRLAINFPDTWKTEMIWNSTGEIAGAVIRRQQSVAGVVELSAVPAGQPGQNLIKVSVRISNSTPFEPEANLAPSRKDALMSAFVSTHTLLAVHGGEFVSLLEPPPALQPVISDCKNVGAWPVLVGEAGERDLMLSSPIILYDYPETAPESPGDLFDGTEIDEILTLRILTLTDEEKAEIRQTDERGRELLDRTEALSPEQLRALHGTIRNLRPIGRNI